MDTMRSIRFNLLLLLAVCTVPSLSAQTYSPPSGPLYQQYFAKMAYFDSIHAFTPDSVFYHEGGEYAEFQKWFRHWVVRSPHGDMDAYDQIVKGYVDRQAHAGSGFRSNEDPWLELGPKRKRNNMIGIGPIRFMTINREQPDHMLCASATGGVFYTTDAGQNWQNAYTDIGLPHSGCQTAIYYPGTTDSWVALSAFGDDRDNRLGYVGGVFRYMASYGQWEQVGDYGDLGGSNTNVYTLLFDEKLINGNHRLFVTTTSGLWYTNNLLAPNPDWQLPSVTVPASIYALWPGAVVDSVVKAYDVEYLPSANSNTLCASMCFHVNHLVGGNPVISTVWRFMLSTNNGNTWTELASQPAIDPDVKFLTTECSSAAENTFYLLSYSANGSWIKAYDVVKGLWVDIASGFNPTFGAGHAFGVNQADTTSVYVSHGTSLKWYDSNGSRSIPNSHVDIEDIVGNPQQGNEIWVANHGGVNKVTLSGSTSTYLDKSDGLGVAEVKALASSQNVPDYIALGLYHDNSVITHEAYEPVNWNPNYAKLAVGGDGTRCLIERTNEHTVYASGQQGVWIRDDSASVPSPTSEVHNIAISSQWWSEGDLNAGKEGHLYRAFLSRVDTIHYWGNTNGFRFPKTYYNKEIEINRSFTKGTNPEVVSDFAHNSKVSHWAAAVDSFHVDTRDNEMFWWVNSNPANPNHLYVSLRNWDWQSRVYRTTQIDNPDVNAVKASWEEVPHPRRVELYTNDNLRQPDVTAIAFDPQDENTIYLAYASSQTFGEYNEPFGNRMVFKMDVSDLGQYPWGDLPFECPGTPCRDITMNLPNTFIDIGALMAEQGSDGGLYVATEAGVYFTDNKRIAAYNPALPEDPDDLANGSGWVKLGGALPHVSSRGIEANYQVNRVRVGLTGRGVWEHHLHCPDTMAFTETGTYGSNRYLEALENISSAAVVPAQLDLNYRAGEEVRLTPGFHASSGARFHAFIHPCDAPGNSFHPKMIEVAEVPPLDSEAKEAQDGIRLFPNPANGFFTIIADFIPEKGDATARVYGATGNLALSFAMQGPKQHVEASGLHGLFMVVVESAGVLKTAKIILQ